MMEQEHCWGYKEGTGEGQLRYTLIGHSGLSEAVYYSLDVNALVVN